MKLVTTAFQSGGLHEKHFGNHLSICFWAQGNQETPVSRENTVSTMTIGYGNYIIFFRVGPNLVVNVVVVSCGECRTWAYRPLPCDRLRSCSGLL